MKAEESSKNLITSDKIKIALNEFINSKTSNTTKDRIKIVVDTFQGIFLKEISDIVLEEATKLTRSKYCYVAYLDQENGDSVGISFTKMTPECDMYKDVGEARFPIRKDGTYGGLLGYSLDTGESFYTHDPASHPAAHGIPEGHTHVYQFLSVPVIFDGEIIGQIVLGNPEENYNDNHLEVVNKIANFYALILQKFVNTH